MKNINIPLEEERHGDLELIQDFYSRESGVKLSKAQTLKRLIYESANTIRNMKVGEENIRYEDK